MLAERQPDFQEHGRLFSYTIIYIANILVIGVWMVLIGTPKLPAFGTVLGSEIATTYAYAGHYILIFCEKIETLIHMITSGSSGTSA